MLSNVVFEELTNLTILDYDIIFQKQKKMQFLNFKTQQFVISFYSSPQEIIDQQLKILR